MQLIHIRDDLHQQVEELSPDIRNKIAQSSCEITYNKTK